MVIIAGLTGFKATLSIHAFLHDGKAQSGVSLQPCPRGRPGPTRANKRKRERERERWREMETDRERERETETDR